MEKKQFIKVLNNQNLQHKIKGKKIIINGGYVNLRSLTSLPKGVEFRNGGDVYLRSLTSLPEGVEFHNGGNVGLDSLTKKINTPYLDRFRINQVDGFVTLHKRVSKDYKTQEGRSWETEWLPGTTVTHPAWSPERDECGGGKFHACARPGWCDVFRGRIKDKYIAIRIAVKDLYEWENNPSYPQKIGFREGFVIGECDREGNII